MGQRLGQDRLLTVPNVLTTSRLGFLVTFILLLGDSTNRLWPTCALAAAGVTDYFDGFVARRFGQATNIGKLLDPVVDRVVLGTTVIAIAVYHAVPLWVAIAVLVREAIIVLAGVGLGLRGVRKMEVLPIGKAGTFGLMVAFPLFLFSSGTSSIAHPVRVTAWIIFVPALLCSWAAAVAYVPAARRAAVAAGGRTLKSSVP